MANENIVNNAVNAEATRVDGPPAPVGDVVDFTPSPEALERITAIRGDKDYYNSNSPRQKALAAEMRKLTSVPAAVASPKQEQAKGDAAATPAQQELAAIKKTDAYWKGDHSDHQKVMMRVRQLLALEEQANPEDAQRRADMTAADLREEFGVEKPKLTMPGLAWNEADEATFYQTAHQQGWEPALVRELMRDYVDRAQAHGGVVTDEMV